MRVRLTVLLIAMLPALVPPVGTLRFCLCLDAQAATASCCKTRCCEDPVADGLARLSADKRCSGCQLLSTPKRDAIEPSKAPGKHTLLLKLAPLSMAFLPEVTPVLRSRVTLIDHPNSAPCPSRTLPLLI